VGFVPKTAAWNRAFSVMGRALLVDALALLGKGRLPAVTSMTIIN
jgi:hypothetical protein